MTTGLYSLLHQRLVPFIAGASLGQRIEWLYIFKDLFVKLDARKRRQEVVELARTQLPLSLIQFTLCIVNLTLWSPYSDVTNL
jgi:hypothetical protein